MKCFDILGNEDFLRVLRSQFGSSGVQMGPFAYSGQGIDCTFHPDCKDIVHKEIRRGRILLLEDPVVFSLGVKSQKSNLVIMKKCIVKIFQ